VLETPGGANALRIVNTGPVEFPIESRVEPFYVVDEFQDDYFYDTVGTQSPKATVNWNDNFLGKLFGSMN
jgi:hypothetical protein